MPSYGDRLLANPVGQAWDINGAGQSGHPLSPHHHDQAERWVQLGAGGYGLKLMDSASFGEMKELTLNP